MTTLRNSGIRTVTFLALTEGNVVADGMCFVTNYMERNPSRKHIFFCPKTVTK